MKKELTAEEFLKILDRYVEEENEWLLEANPKLGSFRIEARESMSQTDRGQEGILVLCREEEDSGPTESLYNLRANLNTLKGEWDRRVESFRLDDDDLPYEEEKFFQAVFKELEDKQERFLAARTADEIVQYSYDPQSALNCLLPAVCNRLRNADFLKRVPHRDLHDLAIYYRVSPALQDKNSMIGSFPVTTDILEQMNRASFPEISEGKLFDTAYENAVKVHETIPFHQMAAQIMSESMGVELVPVEGQEEDGFVTSNAIGQYGAAGSFLGIGMEELSTQCSKNLYLVPSSIHEALIYVDNGEYSTEEIAEKVSNLNINLVGYEDYLSDNVYYYDRDTKKITVVYDGYSKMLTADAPENRCKEDQKKTSESPEQMPAASLQKPFKSQPSHRRR